MKILKKLLPFVFSLLLTACGFPKHYGPTDFRLPDGATFVKEIGQSDAHYTLIVSIEGKEYIWVYYHGGNATYATLCPRIK